MDDLTPPVWRLAIFAGLALITAVAAGWWYEPLPPTATPLYAIPPLLGGIYLAVAATWIREVGLYGWIARSAPEAGHAAMQALGSALAGVGLWVILALPPAGAGELARLLPELDGLCTGPPQERLEREVLPILDRLESLRSGQSEALVTKTDSATRALLRRCAIQARVAFADEAGTHASWRRLRAWMAEHPDRHGLTDDDPFWSQVWRERAPPEPSLRVVPVILQP